MLHGDAEVNPKISNWKIPSGCHLETESGMVEAYCANLFVNSNIK